MAMKNQDDLRTSASPRPSTAHPELPDAVAAAAAKRAGLLFESMADTTLLLFLTSLSAMAKVLLISLVGFFSALYPAERPLLSKESCGHISRVMQWVCLPCLTLSSLGMSLSAASISALWVLLPWAVLNVLFSLSIGTLMVQAVLRTLPADHPDHQLARAFIIGIGFPNTVAMGLLIMQTLCQQQPTLTAIPQCFESATSMVFVYSVGWQILYWSVGYAVLETSEPRAGTAGPDEVPEEGESTEKEGGGGGADTAEEQRKAGPAGYSGDQCAKLCRQLVCNPMLLPIPFGLAIGLTSGGTVLDLQDLLFFNDMSALRPLGGALQTIGQPIVCVCTLLLAASLGHAYAASLGKRELTGEGDGGIAMSDSASAAEESAVQSRNVNPLDEGDHKTMQERGGGEAAMGPEGGSASSSAQLPSWRLVAVFGLSRLVIIPSLGFSGFHLLEVASGGAGKSVLTGGENVLLRLVILLQFALPSAQFVIMVLQQFGFHDTSSRLAYAYVFQYVAMMITLTAFCTVAMFMALEAAAPASPAYDNQTIGL